MKRRIQVNGFIIFVCFVLVIIFPVKFLRLTETRFYNLLGILGMVFILFGLLLRVSSRGFKSEYSRGGDFLVQEGPYALVRNPMYLGIFCISLGIILLLFQWWVLLVFIAFFVIRYVTLIMKEEKSLIKKFGQVYIDYQKKVPRAFPRPSALINKDVLKYLPLKLNWIKKEMNNISVLLLGSSAVEIYKEIKSSKHIFFLPHFFTLVSVIGAFIIFSIFLTKHYESIPK